MSDRSDRYVISVKIERFDRGMEPVELFAKTFLVGDALGVLDALDIAGSEFVANDEAEPPRPEGAA